MLTLDERIKLALDEDIAAGDITTAATVTTEAEGAARIIARQHGIFCGGEVARRIFDSLDSAAETDILCSDGVEVQDNQQILSIRGSMPALLKGERLALNLLGRMSGIATLTRQFADAVKGTGCRILDTRKTTPLWRDLEKYAVRMGGGINHRHGLHDMYLIKENHIAACGGIPQAIRGALRHREKNGLSAPVEIEVRNLEEFKQVMEFPVERVLLDNMTPGEVAKIVKMSKGKYELEVSGGMNLESVQEYAQTGVDFISVGKLTHSVPVFDLSMLFENVI